MPLGECVGDNSNTHYCGVETEFKDDIKQLLDLSGNFDFVVTPLMHPGYRPSLLETESAHGYAFSDIDLSPSDWSSLVIGKCSSWIDPDSEDQTLRKDSEIALQQEIAWASFLNLPACVLPTPKRGSSANYARCVSEILQSKIRTQLWLRIPLNKSDGKAKDVKSNQMAEEPVDSWEMWNYFRVLCEHHNQLSVVLDVWSTMPSRNSIRRWLGEPVRAAIIHTNFFTTGAMGPFLSRERQNLVTDFFHHSAQIIVSDLSVPKRASPTDKSVVFDKDPMRHPLQSYLDYFCYMYRRMAPLSESEISQIDLRDVIMKPLQPLVQNTDLSTYETFEKDKAKYEQYESAISLALLDRIRDEEISTVTIVLMVVGAGRGPLVMASIKAASETRRKLRIYAVEKNPNAIVSLQGLVKLKGWENLVTIVSGDMRKWNAPEKADILVSEMLGSFGDNELSPECLDGAQRFLKDDGISIPSSYTNFIQPITSWKLFNHLKLLKDPDVFETAHVIKLHHYITLAPSQPVFTFNHPNISTTRTNQRYKKICFAIPRDIGTTLVHGFAGYFDAILYKDIHIGIEPSTATPNLVGWFPFFLPLREPVYVPSGASLEVHIWRCCSPSKVWYEWCLTSPVPSRIHNTSGRSYSADL